MTAQVISPLVITPAGGALWRLINDLVVLLKDGTRITVRAGYATDGESGPNWAKDIFIKANTFRQTAAFLHDALYQAGIDKDWADKVYAQVLLGLGVNESDEEDLFHAVHIFAHAAYAADQANISEKLAAQQHLSIDFPV